MLEPGDDIDIWVVQAALGTGGMGSVYRCHNRSATRILAAVKVLDGAVRAAKGAQERFVREAEILYTLNHPNIVKVRNIRIDSDPAYIEMEFVKGESLESHLRRGPLPFGLALSVMRELSDAVAYLHEKGVCHRDLKPANILIDEDGHTRIVDFGLALESDRSRLTQAGMTFGTVSYAPPEWITPEDLQPQMWDLYGLGVIFWEILTGRVAFAVSGQGSVRQQAMQVIMAKQDHPPLDPGGRFHADIRQLIGGMTHSHESERIQHMREVADWVKRFDESMVQAPNLTLTPAAPQRRGSGPITWDDSLPPASAAPKPPAREPDATTLVRERRVPWVLVTLGAVAAGTVALCSGAYVATQLGGPVAPTVRAAELQVQGIGDRTVHLAVADQALAVSGDGIAQLAPRQLGDLPVTWSVGDGCDLDLCPGSACPAWCATGVELLTLGEGEGLASLAVSLPETTTYDVTLGLPEHGEMTVHLALDGQAQDVADDGPTTLTGVSPGAYLATVGIGDCPEALVACEDDCPPGCSMVSVPITVPWDGLQDPVDVDIAVPEVPVRAAVVRAPSGRFVTHRAFARWLASHPEYQREAAMANGRGDQNHLAGWDGTTPPAGRAGAPIVNVSWSAANAYCAGRGGLPSVESELPVHNDVQMEFRRNGSEAVVLEDGTRRIPITPASGATPITSFRCAQ